MTAQSQGTAGVGHSLDRVTVLLIDDDETWVRVTGRLLETNNDALDVTIANSLAEGRATFERLDPDCVVCDYQLGDGTGLALLETVRLADSERPFLLVTGRGDEGVASEAIGQRVTDYIRKDQDDDESGLLASRIKAAVRSYRAERALEREQRSKTALLDILTGTTAQADLSQEFCACLVTERNYACAVIARETSASPPVPNAFAGRESYYDAVYAPGEPLPAGEPARKALDRNESVLTRLDGSTYRESAARTEWESLATDHGFEGAVAVPIRHDGVRFGVLAAYTDDSSVLDGGEREAIEAYAETVGYALTNAERKRSLMSPRPVEVRVDIDSDAVPLGVLSEALSDAVAVDVLSAVPRDNGTTLYVTTVDGVSGGFEAAVAEADGIRSLSVDRSTSPTRCELVADAATPESCLANHGVVVEGTTLSSDTTTLDLSVPDGERVSTVQDVLRAEFEDATVSTVWTRQGQGSSVTGPEVAATLTDRQREVLRHALEVGYFQRPRKTTATELAAHFDRSRATISQHLRTAQRKVFTRLFDERRED